MSDPGRAGRAGSRVDRKTLWIGAGVLAGLTLLCVFLPAKIQIVRFILFLGWIVLYGQRLHDFGRSAWWQGLIYLAMLAVGVGLVFAGVNWELATAGAYLPQLAFTIWLGLVPGDPGPNRFGAPLRDPTRRAG